MFSTKILLYTGKGGVGKSTISAATALRCGDRGLKTLVISTDPAHSLSDAFDKSLGDDPVQITENLDGMEINVQRELRRNWGAIQSYMTSFFSFEGMKGVASEEFSILPGMEEMFSLLRLRYLVESGEYDVVVVDCAPTAGTLQLLTFPDIARWYMEHLFGIERKVMKVVRPVAKHMTSVPLPDEEVFDSIERLFTDIDVLVYLLSNPEITTVRLVLNPEKMVLKETQRAYTYLLLYGLNVDEVVVNRVIPEEATCGYLEDWFETQKEYIQLIEQSFSPMSIRQLRLFKNEVVGLEMLRRVGEGLYGDDDPTDIKLTQSPLNITGDE
ncbi:MAG: ArsA family ATPase [Methermicoccaceae archaeon]